MSNMSLVTASLRGRLGNQLWQWAAAIAYGLETGRCFIAAPHPNAGHDRAEALGLEVSRDVMLGNFTRIREEMQGTYKALPHIAGDVILDGYFQSYRYFWKWWEQVRGLFPGPLPALDIESGDTAVHVRLGDYYKSAHFVQQAETGYYLQASDNWDAGRRFFVFSDEPDKAEHLLFKGRRPDNVVILPQYNESLDVAVLLHMASYPQIIGANSSFSAWAAFLSGHNNVIFPKAWYAGVTAKSINTADMFPPRWRRI